MRGAPDLNRAAGTLICPWGNRPHYRPTLWQSARVAGFYRRMIGMDARTGSTLSGDAHLAQSLADILSTPLGSRVMRHDYGSLLFDLLDQPVNGALRMLLQAATAIAIGRWEPRLKLDRVRLQGDPSDGALAMRIEGRRTDLPTPNTRIALSIPIRRGASPLAS